MFPIEVNSRSDWLSKREYFAWTCTCAWSDIADVSRKQKILKTLKLFWTIFRTSLLRNSSHYILNTIFYNREALTGVF